MLRLLNHSKGLKVGKWIVSEKKKPSDKQPSGQTNYTKHQTEDKCTARFATNTISIFNVWTSHCCSGEKQQAALQPSSARWDVTGLSRASAAASYLASPASSSTADREEWLVLMNWTHEQANSHYGMWSVVSEQGTLTREKNHLITEIRKCGDTSSSFILISFSVSTSGVESGRMGMGLSIRLSWASLLKRRSSRRRERGEVTRASFYWNL